MAWAWIPIGFVVVAAGRFVGLHPLVATGVTAVALVAVGLLRTRTRRVVTLETAGLLLYGALAVGALLLAPAVGLVVVALTLIAHGVWDVWHLRRHRDLVSPSLAEACIALDVPLGLAVLVVALARAGRPGPTRARRGVRRRTARPQRRRARRRPTPPARRRVVRNAPRKAPATNPTSAVAYERATARSSTSAEVSAGEGGVHRLHRVRRHHRGGERRPTDVRNAAICIPAANAITAVTTTDSVPAGKNPTTTSTPTSRPSVANCGAGVPSRRDHPRRRRPPP